MIFSHICESCGHAIQLEFDESDCTPTFCPFCGEDLMDEGEFDNDPDSSVDWAEGDAFDNF